MNFYVYLKIKKMSEKVDLNRVKFLRDKLEGKEVFEPKPMRVIAKLTEEMETEISIGNIRMGIKPKPPIKNIAPDPGLETPEFLFFFKGKYYFIENKVMTKITGADVKMKRSENPYMEIYFLCSDTICPMPDELTGLTKKAVKVENDQGAIDLMNQKSGTNLTVKNL